MNGSEVFPSISDNKFDHDIAAWLINSNGFCLPLASVRWDLPWLSNDFEAVAVRGLAAFNSDLFDASADESHFVHNLCLLELNGELLGEHTRRQPIRVIVPVISDSKLVSQKFWRLCVMRLTRERLLGQISRQS